MPHSATWSTCSARSGRTSRVRVGNRRCRARRGDSPRPEVSSVKSEPLIFVGTCDLAGLVRGKGFPAEDWQARMRKGIGLTHSNIMMSPFGPIYDTPFGTQGDLMLVPDSTTKVEVE